MLVVYAMHNNIMDVDFTSMSLLASVRLLITKKKRYITIRAKKKRRKKYLWKLSRPMCGWFGVRFACANYIMKTARFKWHVGHLRHAVNMKFWSLCWCLHVPHDGFRISVLAISKFCFPSTIININIESTIFVNHHRAKCRILVAPVRMYVFGKNGNNLDFEFIWPALFAYDVYVKHGHHWSCSGIL